MEWNGTEQNRIVPVRRDYSSHLVQLPDQKIRCIIKGIVQMALKHWQE